MNMTRNTSLALAVIATIALGTTAHAIQKHDPIFQAKPIYTASDKTDPDMLTQLRYQGCSPHARRDWYAIHVTPAAEDYRNLAREVGEQYGSPHAKQDPTFMLAPVK